MKFARLRLPIVLALAAALVVPLAAVSAKSPGTYRVTIVNLTGGQPFTPPVVVTHSKKVHLFEVGSSASTGVQEIAENGNDGPLKAALAGAPHVDDVVTGATGPLVPAGRPGATVNGFGQATSVMVSGDGSEKYLSFISMLVCTNDGFTGVDALRLPKHIGDTAAAYTDAYDAGTETNTENFADLVPPCQGLIGITGADGTGVSNPGLAEGGVIHHHGGIVGISGLVPGVHGLTNPVGLIVVERVS